MEDLTLGFLSSCKFEEGSAIRGAIMVTDAQTKPLEFRVTAPVRPTNFQKTLYGNILVEHILVELISLPVLKALTKKPDIVIIRDPLFLGGNARQDIPIVRIFKDGEARFNSDESVEVLSPLAGKYEPLFIESSEKYNSKLPELRKALTEILSSRSLFEPFDRITTALQQVHAQKPGE